MASKIFLDANVCIDFLLQRKGFEPSEEIFERILSGELKAYTSPAIIHIIAYFLKKVHEIKVVKNVLLNLLTDIKVIDSNHEVTVAAVNSNMTDIEDALEYYTAIHHKMDYFISLDKHLQKAVTPMLPIYSPAAFLKLNKND